MDFYFFFQLLFFINRILIDDANVLMRSSLVMKKPKTLETHNLKLKAKKIGFAFCDFFYNAAYLIFLISLFYPILLQVLSCYIISNLFKFNDDFNVKSVKLIDEFEIYPLDFFTFSFVKKDYDPNFSFLQILILNSKKFTFI